MLKLIGRRLISMVLIIITASLLLFLIFDSDDFKKRIALAELGNFGVSAMSEASYQEWLANKGLDIPFHERFVRWVGDISTGDLGRSFAKNADVSKLIVDRLANTGILAL